ncbi:hypothetical protein CUJ91_00470 [Paraburkholderia graminis]|uniref:hypothetical protein n=1 Tax=Paraburkholderia graminis TaxID=60548 RepID=UPI000DEF191E|nr:hypothetical protein [Paraburkholderia graminis]AXF06532.1 hypothetical protein CUJ91_00470 [Paraburkholderia graminis]
MSNRPRFRMGHPVITPAAQSVLEQAGISPTVLLERHLRGDWGELDIADIASNELALLIHRRLLSSYLIPGGGRIWVITEADRSLTTILLPSDY